MCPDGPIRRGRFLRREKPEKDINQRRSEKSATENQLLKILLLKIQLLKMKLAGEPGRGGGGSLGEVLSRAKLTR